MESKAVAASSQQEILGLQVEVQRVQVLRQASIPSLLSKFGQDLIRDSGSNAGQQKYNHPKCDSEFDSNYRGTGVGWYYDGSFWSSI